MLTCRDVTEQLNNIKQLKHSCDKKLETALSSHEACADAEKQVSLLKEAIRVLELKLAAEAKDFYVNPEVVERFNLKRVEIKGDPEAQSLIDQVCDRKIDITTEEGQKYFVQQWLEKVRLPLPCLVKNVNSNDEENFTYLKILYQGNVKSLTDITSITESAGFRVRRPDFASNRTLYVDNWKETDWGYDVENSPLEKNDISLILNRLGLEHGVIAHSRLEIDKALWVGDPAERNPTEKHKEILRGLGVFEDDVYIRLISYHEYLACSQKEGLKNLGKKELFTMFDDRHQSEDVGDIDLLIGGYNSFGGVACCRSMGHKMNYARCAIRLVISKD